MIRAIETYYNGYRFRSRLEARWAVFLDALGVKYEYEPEGFTMNGIYYLPDFRVTCYGTRGSCEDKYAFDLYIEVKSSKGLSDDESNKIEMFSGLEDGYCDYELNKSDKRFPVLIVTEIPNVQTAYDCIDTSLFGSYESIGHDIYPFNYSTIDGDYFGAFPSADNKGRFYLMGDEGSYLIKEDCPRLIKAYQKARQARFEYGENP